jgi:hypothetical protein
MELVGQNEVGEYLQLHHSVSAAGKSKDKGQAIPKRRCGDNIKTEFEETGRDGL